MEVITKAFHTKKAMQIQAATKTMKDFKMSQNMPDAEVIIQTVGIY